MAYPLAFSYEKCTVGNICYHGSPAYSTSNSKTRSTSLNLYSQEGNLVDNIIKEEMHISNIKESDYILHKSRNLHRYPTLSTLNEIIMKDSNDQVDR